MNTKRFAKSVAISAGLLILLAVQGRARAYSTPTGAVQTPTPAVPGPCGGQFLVPGAILSRAGLHP